MDLEKLQQANILVERIEQMKEEKRMFSSKENCVILNTSDMYGNKGRTLRLYDNHNVETNKFPTYYKEFLEKCEADIEQQIVALEYQLEVL
jgi:hypothetical protein